MEENPEHIATNDAEDSLSFVQSELEALQSIYINEIEVKQDDEQRYTCVSIDLHPATADKPEEQYVKMTLKLTLNEEYPHSIPDISIRNPRGLSDEKINSTYQDLISIAEKKMGNSMLFEIIEAAKEHLTAGNRPCGECAICLYGFSESDVFIKTDCYHYFHSHCLACYAKNAIASENKDKDSNAAATNTELLCPMCRVPIEFLGADELYPPPSAADDECLISEQILEMQKKMSDIYQKQLEKGGIIDVEAEKNKYLLEISNVPTLSNTVEKSDSVTEENDTSEKVDENACNAPQVTQKEKAQSTKEVKESKSTAMKSDDKIKHNKRFNKNRNHNSHNNFPRNSRKQKTLHDSYDEDLDDEDSFREDVEESLLDIETDLPQSRDARSNSTAYPSPHSKFSMEKGGQRSGGYNKPRRGNQDGSNRGNYSRYPRKNARGHNSNQRHHFDHTDQGTVRFDSSKDVKPSDSNSANQPAQDSPPLEETKDSQPVENCDSYKNNYEFDKRGKNRGRFPRNGYRGRGGNASRKDNYGRNRQEINYDSHREKVNFNNRYSNNLEEDSPQDGGSTKASSFREDMRYRQDMDNNGRNYKSNPRRQQRANFQRATGMREETSLQGENSHIADSTDNDATSHKIQSLENHEVSSQEPRNNSAQEGNMGRSRNAADSAEPHDERRFNSHKNNYNQGYQSNRNQFHNRRNDYEENGRQHQRYENYSQSSGLRRNRRDAYGNNANMNQKGFQHTDQRGGRGRNNPRFQNRQANYEGGQRRFQYNQENTTLQSNRNAYRSAPRKSEDRYSNASSQNGRFNGSGTDQGGNVCAQPCPDISQDKMNGSKSFDESNVKAFVPKEDSSVPFGGDVESHSQKVSYPPPGFNNPTKKIVYGLEAAKPPPGFPRR